MAGPEQSPEAPGSGDRKGLQNGIRGLERLQLIQAPPEDSGVEGTKGVLSPKVRRSIERKIINRQNKIEAALSVLASAPDATQLQKLIEEDKKVEEITALLGEQSIIAEKESLGNIDHRPFQVKIQAIEDAQRNLIKQFISKVPFDIPSEIERLRNVIVPRSEEPAPSPEKDAQKIDTDNSPEHAADKLIDAALKEPQILKTVFEEKLPKATQAAWEHEQARLHSRKGKKLPASDVATQAPEAETKKGESREAGASSAQKEHNSESEGTHSRGWNDIVLDVGRVDFLERREGKDVINVRGTEMAREIRKLVARFQNEEFQRVTPKKKRRRAILSELDSLTSNEKLKGDLLKAFEAKGWMPLEGTLSKETTTLPQGEKVEEPSRPSAERIAPVKEGKVLEHIIADVSKTPSFGREQGKKIIAVSGEDAAKDIRKLVQDFQKEEFKNLSKEAQTKTILDSINTLTSHPRLRADLREAFREMGLLETAERQPKVALSPEEKRRLAFRRSGEYEGVPAAYHIEPEGISPFMKRRKALNQLPITPPAVPSAPKTVERQKTPEVRRAEALGDYFMKVESGTDFLQRIVSMPEDNKLRGSMQLSELERLSGELSQKVIDFFALIETWEQDKKSATEMARSKEEFITSHAVPSGCQTAFRTVALFAINKILGPVTETLKAPRKTKPPSPPPPPPAPATGEATEGAPFSYRPRSVDEVLDELVTGAPAPAHSAPQATETAPAAESPKAVPASEGEAESFLERVRARGSRLWNPPRESTIKTPPSAPPGVEAPPPSPVPSTETAPPAPPAPPDAESAPIPAATPQAAETASPLDKKEAPDKFATLEAKDIFASLSLGEGRIGVTRVEVGKSYNIKFEGRPESFKLISIVINGSTGEAKAEVERIATGTQYALNAYRGDTVDTGQILLKALHRENPPQS